MHTIKVFKRSKPNKFSDMGNIEFIIADHHCHVLASSNLAQLARTAQKTFLSNGGKVLYEVSEEAPNFSKDFKYSTLNKSEISQFKTYVSSAKKKYSRKTF